MILEEVSILLYCMHHAGEGRRYLLQDEGLDGEPAPTLRPPPAWEDLQEARRAGWRACAEIVLSRAAQAFPGTIESLLRPAPGSPLEPHDT